MIDKCANPDCGAPFEYNEGKFFRFRRQNEESETPAKAKEHAVQHFWLCGRCAETYVLQYHKDRGVMPELRLKVRHETLLAHVVRGD